MNASEHSPTSMRTNSYDAVPYDILAFPQTHPDRLATTARIFGLQPPPVATSRVLELGCASGGNLIPMAFNLPGATFVGIDLSGRQIEGGRETISALGITNATLRHASILDVSAEWGQFDYIICHGVFSWVEADVQDKILHIANENLSPSGVAYISYNTYPGWHMREMVRHMMRYHASRFEESPEQIDQARALLAFLITASDASGPYGELLQREVERLSQTSDSYLYHEHLEPTNAPIYFHQFVERAERAGLQYLSEASVSDMLTSQFPAPVAETLERISPDILHLEQYMDFVRNRQFRQTLLCHDGLKPRRALTPDFLHGLMVSSRALAEELPVDLSSGKTVVFWNGKQRAEAILPATKAAFTILTETWPEAIAIDELCTTALGRAASFLDGTSVQEAQGALMGDLFGGVMYGMLELHTAAPSCTNLASYTPRANRMAAYQASHGTRLVSAHHDTLEFDTLTLEVLKLCDGRRRQSDIVDALLERHADGSLTIDVEGKPVTEVDGARTVLADRVEKAVATLARSAVLVE